ncbi:hypothetical protein SAMN03159341_107208 [Paenibacillus sp. 1_12]|uniref:hypothetical protein n=1 Tax=Paenibacillus sp. 1_12 TaxID=1566278 RepID=UPI0008ED7DF4|nr:hypothetical protein [Paenibacillus sp. 1_12]SFL57706.1 hypothetical protein SAMN03159341_107208 [Paenibacillus sp. 1_12]
MNTQLIIVEGLPGSGKSTAAQLILEILTEMNIEAQLFKEGDLNHPADYDGVAYFSKSEFDELLSLTEEFRDILNVGVTTQGNDYFLPYRVIENEIGLKLPDVLSNTIYKNDIYELPLNQNMNLVVDKWGRFTESALNNQKVYIFECCFIQNPVTVGMIKYDSPKEKIKHYVTSLAKIIACLNPLLIYIEQDDLEFSFNKAVKERPKEWSDGFVNYYTSQGYGKEHGYIGIDGTLQVLQARAKLENEILDLLELDKVKINNSSYGLDRCRSELIHIMRSHYVR